MRTGENALAIINGVKEAIARLTPSLPPGVSVRPFYDRSHLIERSIGTLRNALFWEIALVVLAHILFLWHFRSILIVTLPLPASILISFILMKEFGITSNIMSLSGIAIAIGVLVDAGIVMTENVIRQCERRADRKSGHEPLTASERREAVREAPHQVGRPIFFSMLIIILAFVPVFALTGGFLLQFVLGYNFSVAVWVGYIALFGTAIETAIVMAVYLNESVAATRAERGQDFCHSDLIEAVKGGARSRLRPKVMTVATTVAGLLPVMRPLAAPVIGGMICSFLHILIFTPVLFAWLCEREFGLGPASRTDGTSQILINSASWTQSFPAPISREESAI